jgi:hypothetical protein
MITIGARMRYATAFEQTSEAHAFISDNHAVVLARHRFTRANGNKDYRTAHVYDIIDGKLARCFEQPREPGVFDEAWGAAMGLSASQGA